MEQTTSPFSGINLVPNSKFKPRLVRNLNGDVALEYVTPDYYKHTIELCAIIGLYQNPPHECFIQLNGGVVVQAYHTYEELMALLYPITDEE
jgi:hypothetical protein